MAFLTSPHSSSRPLPLLHPENSFECVCVCSNNETFSEIKLFFRVFLRIFVVRMRDRDISDGTSFSIYILSKTHTHIYLFNAFYTILIRALMYASLNLARYILKLLKFIFKSHSQKTVDWF